MTMIDHQTRVIPAHPEWCEGPLGNPEHCPSDPYHRGDALRLDVQKHEIGFSVGLAQSDEHGGDRRDIGEPQLEFTMKHRLWDEFAHCMLTEDDTVRLIGMLQRSLSDLRGVREAATSPVESDRLTMTLGWTPEDGA